MRGLECKGRTAPSPRPQYMRSWCQPTNPGVPAALQKPWVARQNTSSAPSSALAACTKRGGGGRGAGGGRGQLSTPIARYLALVPAVLVPRYCTRLIWVCSSPTSPPGIHSVSSGPLPRVVLSMQCGDAGVVVCEFRVVTSTIGSAVTRSHAHLSSVWICT